MQFPVLKSYEDDTWYDQNGNIVFTNNRSLTNVGVSRSEWENIRYSFEDSFKHLYTTDALPNGPLEIEMEFVPPYDYCNREADYETAWNLFQERYGDKK